MHVWASPHHPHPHLISPHSITHNSLALCRLSFSLSGFTNKNMICNRLDKDRSLFGCLQWKWKVVVTKCLQQLWNWTRPLLHLIQQSIRTSAKKKPEIGPIWWTSSWEKKPVTGPIYAHLHEYIHKFMFKCSRIFKFFLQGIKHQSLAMSKIFSFMHHIFASIETMMTFICNILHS